MHIQTAAENLLFDDIFYEVKTGDLFSDVVLLWQSLFKSEKGPDMDKELEPFLYAETLWPLAIHPESVAIAGIVHNFNLYKDRFPDKITIVKPRSFCPNCGNMIRWWMNLPILSYVFLGGKCYFCKTKISIRYPLIEALSGFLCGALFYVFGIESLFTFLFYYTLAAICIVVFFIDFDQWLILDEITIPFSLVGVIGSLFVPVRHFVPLKIDLFNPASPPGIVTWFNGIVKSSPAWLHPDSFVHSLGGAILGFAGFWAIAVIGTALAKREAMGGGDIKFAMLMGAFLGPQKMLIAFFLSVFVGTAFMLPGLILKFKTGKDQVPFGCFLTISTVLTIFYGDKLVDFYVNWPQYFNLY